MILKNIFGDLMMFRRSRLEFGLPCAWRSFHSPEFKNFRPTFRSAYFLTAEDPVILDIGANRGDFAQACHLRWKRPQIFCCEPQPVVCGHLKSRFEFASHIHCFNVAIANHSGTAVFNQTQDSLFSSFLPLNYNYLDFGSGCEVVQTISVKCKTLAEMIDEEIGRPVDLMKIDVQGGEADVLATLKQAKHPIHSIQIELSLHEVYRGQPLIQQVIQEMNELNYDLINVYSPQKNNRGIVLHVEGMFVKRDWVNLC